MKKFLLTIFLIAFIGMINANAQSTLIIDEDFQDWAASEGVYTVLDSCEVFPHQAGPLTKEIDYIPGGKLTVTLNNYAINPLCNAKKGNGDGITTGYVSLQKMQGDSIGEIIFNQLPNVSKIEFGVSSTGASRGHRLYTSINGGTTWVGPVGGEHDSTDSQNGNVFTEEINLDNVMIKFTSGIKPSDNTPQNSRYHNIKIYGVPGQIQVGLKKVFNNNLNIFSVSGTGLFRIEGKYNSVRVYNTIGNVVYNQNTQNQFIDLSGQVKGIYIVKAEDASGNIYVKKILKQ